MASLYLDTTDHLILGLLDEKFGWIDYIDEELRNSSTKIHKIIYDVLSKHKLEVSKIETIFQAAGPGSYTGMRVSEGISSVLEWQNCNIYSFYHFEVPSILGISSGHWIANGFKSELFVYKWNIDANSKELIPIEKCNEFVAQLRVSEAYTNFITELFKIEGVNLLSTGEMVAKNPEILFQKVKERGLRLGPYYYRSESNEFKINK